MTDKLSYSGIAHVEAVSDAAIFSLPKDAKLENTFFGSGVPQFGHTSALLLLSLTRCKTSNFDLQPSH